MSKLFFSTLLFSLFITVNAQTADNTTRKNESNIYYHALTQYLLKFEKVNVNFDSIYIEEQNINTDSLLLKSGRTKFFILDKEGIHKLLETHDDLIVYTIFPLEFQNGQFSVSFVPFRVTKDPDKKDLFYSNGGGCRVFYKFKEKNFKFINVKCRGI